MASTLTQISVLDGVSSPRTSPLEQERWTRRQLLKGLALATLGLSCAGLATAAYVYRDDLQWTVQDWAWISKETADLSTQQEQETSFDAFSLDDVPELQPHVETPVERVERSCWESVAQRAGLVWKGEWHALAEDVVPLWVGVIEGQPDAWRRAYDATSLDQSIGVIALGIALGLGAAQRMPSFLPGK